MIRPDAPPAPATPGAVPAGESGTPRLSAEAVRTLRRVGANYARLATTFTLGLILVPVLLGWLGDDAFGLLSVIGSSIGLTTIVLEILDRAMIRELGEAHHSGDPARFLRTYNTALVLAWVAAALFAAACAALIPLVPLLNGVTPPLVTAAVWLAASEAASAAVLISLAPAYNMYQVSERFGAYNLILVVQRSSYFVPAVVLCYGLGVGGDPARSLKLYAAGCAMMNIASVVVPVAIGMALDPRLRPRPALARAGEARAILRTFRAAGLVVVIVSSLERLAAVLGNVLVPSGRALGWNAAFGLSQRAVGHVRTAAEGLTRGLDAVSARMSVGAESGAGVRGLARSMTRLHALVALPAAAALFVLAEPAMALWIGRRAKDPATVAWAVPMVQIMVFGLAARAISDAWLSILYGAGQIGRVARVFFAAGLATPAAVAGLTLLLPAPMNELGPALAVAGSMVLIQFAILVVPAARAIGTTARDLLAPIARPAAATAIACAVPLASLWLMPAWTLPRLLAVLAVFGAVYAGVAWGVALSSSERRRLVALVRGRVAPGPEPVTRPPTPEENMEADAGRIGAGL